MPVPTLVIGLGGTGKQVLYNIRRRIISRYHSLDKMQAIKFLAIDTDNTQVEMSAGGDPEPVEDEVWLDDHEHIYAHVPGTVIADIRDAMRTGTLRDRYPHLHPWLTESDLQLAGVTHGAGQVRKLGRLALFQHWGTVRNRLTDILNDLNNPTVLEKLGISPGQRVEIFVVSSLMGGTGAGMFLDMGYLLRCHTNQMGVESALTGIFVVPQTVVGSHAWDYRAIAYAALWELNHLNDSGTDYEAYWPGAGRQEFHEPPYEYTYLLSVDNAGVTLTPQRLVQMIGQVIFMRATSDFAHLITTMRTNFQPQMGMPDHYGNNQWFMTFGFSSIEVPVETVVNACAWWLLADAWREIRGPDPAPAIDHQQLERYVEDFGLSPLSIAESVLQVPDASGISRPVRDCIRARYREGLAGISRVLDNPLTKAQAIMGQIRKAEEEIEDELMGRCRVAARDALHRIQEWAPQRVRTAVLNRFADQGARITGAEQLLRKLDDYLAGQVDNLHALAEQWDQELKKAREERSRAARHLRACLRDALLFAHRPFVVQKEIAETYIPVAEKYYLLLIRNEIVGPHLNGLLNGLRNAVRDLLTQVENLRGRVEGQINACGRKGDRWSGHLQPINGEVIYIHEGAGDTGTDARLTYEETLAADPHLPEHWAGEVMKAADCVKPDGVDLFALMGIVRFDKFNKEIARLIAEPDGPFGSLFGIVALEKWFQRHPTDPEARATLEILVARSTPFLPVDPGAAGWDPVNRTMKGAARHADTDGWSRGFDELLIPNHVPRAMAEQMIRGLERSYQVFLYQELAAFPLRLCMLLEGLRARYNTHLLGSDPAPLHVLLPSDAEALRRLRPINKQPTDREERLFLAAVATGRIYGREDPTTGIRTWHFDYTAPAPHFTVHRHEFVGSLEDIAAQIQLQGLAHELEIQLNAWRGHLGDPVFKALLVSYRNFVVKGGFEQWVAPVAAADERNRRVRRVDEYIDAAGLTHVHPARGVLGRPWHPAASWSAPGHGVAGLAPGGAVHVGPGTAVPGGVAAHEEEVRVAPLGPEGLAASSGPIVAPQEPREPAGADEGPADKLGGPLWEPVEGEEEVAQPEPLGHEGEAAEAVILPSAPAGGSEQPAEEPTEEEPTPPLMEEMPDFFRGLGADEDAENNE